MPVIPAEKLWDTVDSNIEVGLHPLGEKIVETIKADLSVPVEYMTRPRGGIHIIRSKSGEHPRRETGKLQAGVDHFVFQSGSIVGLNVYDPVNYARYLDPGMNRPIVTGKDEEFADLFTAVIARAFES